MGEAKRKKKFEEKEDQEVQSLLPEEIIPDVDYCFLRPKNAGEVMRGSMLYLPEDQTGMSREARLKKQFGTVVERPRFDVVAVGPDVKRYKPGQEVIIDRMAVISKGTAIKLSGFGIYFMCREENICAHVKPLSDEDAARALEAHKERRDGRTTITDVMRERDDPKVVLK